MIYINEKDFIDRGTPVNIVGVHPLSWGKAGVPEFGLRPIEKWETDLILMLARKHPDWTWKEILDQVYD